MTHADPPWVRGGPPPTDRAFTTVVPSTDDLGSVVDAAVRARLDDSGQACDAAERFIVADDLYDGFVEKFTAALLDRRSGAPLSSVAAAGTLARQVAAAVAAGATLHTEGERRGAHFPAGVLTGLTTEHATARQELSGPAAMVFRAAGEADALRIANDTPYALGWYVFTTDSARAGRVAGGIEAGMAFVNGVGAEDAELPFGGVKRSGSGREPGRPGIEEFVGKKLVRTVA